MTIREECFPGTAFAGCTGYPFPTLSFRAQREIFFVTPFASSFAKPFIGSTAHRLSAIRCFPFLAVGRAPSYRQRKRSLGFARDDDTGRTHFPHTLCMIQRISIPPSRHFERSEKSSLHSALSCFLRRWIPVFCYHTYDIIPSCKKDPSTSVGMTMRMALCSRYFHAATPKSASSRHIDPSLWPAPSLRRAKKGSLSLATSP